MFKFNKDEFNSWLSKRIYRASTGEILDLEEGVYVDVAVARGEVFLEHTRMRGEYHKRKFTGVILSKSLDQAKADPNDPFAFTRTRTHLENGLCGLDDYSIDFRRVATDLLDFTGEIVGRKMVDMPMKVRRA